MLCKKQKKKVRKKNSIYFNSDPEIIYPKFINYKKAVPKKVGFDFVSLGWKTKWTDTDYRFEWAPLWSFVFFKWQFCILFSFPETVHYWECWLYYYYNTNKKLSVKERIKQCKEVFPCIWTSTKNGVSQKIDYYNYILKGKYL